MTPTETLIAQHLDLASRELARGDHPAAARAFSAALTLDARASDRIADFAPRVAVSLYTQMLRINASHTPVRELLAYAHLRAGDHAVGREILAEVDRTCAGASAEALHLHSIYSQGLIATGTAPSFGRRLRFVTLMEVFDSVRSLEGALAECGCLRGLSAMVLARRARDHRPGFAGEDFHIFDSFAGLSEPLAIDLEGADAGVLLNAKKGNFEAGLDVVRGNLADFPGIRYYKGWIPERFPEVANLKFRFLNLDVDLYEPSRAALMFFYPRLVPGGVIAVDDYNWPGCRAAIEECRQELGYAVVVTPSHQAIIRKH